MFCLGRTSIEKAIATTYFTALSPIATTYAISSTDLFSDGFSSYIGCLVCLMIILLHDALSIPLPALRTAFVMSLWHASFNLVFGRLFSIGISVVNTVLVMFFIIVGLCPRYMPVSIKSYIRYICSILRHSRCLMVRVVDSDAGLHGRGFAPHTGSTLILPDNRLKCEPTGTKCSR